MERRGVKAQPLPVISTPGGVRKPDLWCSNGGTYVIETKFRESDLLDATAKVQNDYIRWSDILGIRGGFAVLYPEELAKQMPPEVLAERVYKARFKVVALFPPRDVRKSFTVYEGSLSEVADFLAGHILRPPEYVEPSTDYIIRVLRELAAYLTAAMRSLTGRDLEGIFGGKEVFKNILQYEEQKYPVEAETSLSLKDIAYETNIPTHSPPSNINPSPTSYYGDLAFCLKPSPRRGRLEKKKQRQGYKQ